MSSPNTPSSGLLLPIGDEPTEGAADAAPTITTAPPHLPAPTNPWSNHTAVGDGRTTFLYVNLIGTSVLVETDKGVVWEGLFSSVSQGEVALQSARLCVTPSIDANAPAYWVDNLKLPMNTVVSISANGNASVPCGQVTAAANVKKVVPQVQTPSEPLDWAADSDDDTLEQAEKKYVPGTFDQFSVNERKFGVKSTYKDTDYTTDLNQRQYSTEERARADKLTRDINRAATTSEAHRIERGLDSNVDEGTLYSDVKRGVDSQNHSNNNSMPQRGSKPSTPASSGVALPSGSSGSWAEQQRLKKAGKSAMGTPANSSNPATPTVPAPASAAKKPSAFEAPSVPVSGATKPITSPLQATPASPAAAAPAPKKSTLSASAMAFNVAAAPWTPGGGGGAPVAPPAILNDILGGTMAIRFLVNKEVDASAFPWMDHPARGGGDMYHHQQPYHQQPRDHHHGGGGRGGGNNYGDYGSQHQHHHHAPQHVQVAPHHSNHGAQHQHHHQHQHQSNYQHHNSHHHGGHQQHHGGGGSSYNSGPRQPFNGGGGERGGSAPPQPHSIPVDMGSAPPTHHMPPPQQQQHAPASIGRGAGIPPQQQANDGPQVSTVMRGRGRGRASGGGVH